MFSNVNFFNYATELFFVHEWNNMYQKAYENLLTLVVNRFTPEPIVKTVFEEIRLQDLFIFHIFERSFIFESGRRIFNGTFPFVCEISYLIQNTENLVLKRILEQNEKWKEFNVSFAIPIREKFLNGIQFPKENPFEDNSEKNKINENEGSETVREIFYRCQEKLSFMPKKVTKQEVNERSDDFSTSANVSPIKNPIAEKNLAEDLQFLSINEKANNPDYYDNNYWNREVRDFDEIV